VFFGPVVTIEIFLKNKLSVLNEQNAVDVLEFPVKNVPYQLVNSFKTNTLSLKRGSLPTIPSFLRYMVHVFILGLALAIDTGIYC
jgi:hypothetical protein